MLATRPLGSLARRLCALLVAACPLLAAAGSDAGARPAAIVVVSDENFPPYVFRSPDGKPEGYLVDLWQLWQRKTGVRVDLRPMDWSEAQRRMLAGEADVIETIYRTPARQPLYDFSSPYAQVPVSVFAHRSIGGLHETASLQGFQVAVQAGDSCAERLERDGLTTLTRYRNNAETVAAASRGQIKIFCMDEYPAHYYLYRLRADQDFVKAFELYRGELRRAVRKGERETLARVEQGMALISADEKAALERKWLHQQPGAPLDWRLLAAAGLALLAVGLLLAGWVLLLQRAVRRKTRELTGHREELERRVEARTAELATLTESLRQSNEELEAVLNAASIGIMLSRERVIVKCNNRLEEMFGYPPGELVGQPSRLLYGSEAEWQRTGAAIAQQVARGETYVSEGPGRRKDGSELWTEIAVRALDPQRPGRGVVVLVEDITRRHETQQAIERARQLAEEAARAKSDFLANMSHEIRTPMNAVIGMTHLALRADPPPRVRDYLLKLQSSGQHLLGVINDILDFSKLEAGKMRLERVGFGLQQVLDDVSTLLAEKCAAKGIELVFALAPDVPANLSGDALRLEQVLINLGNNAVKFTERGAITLRVSVQQRSGDDVLLRFEVSDTGIGISSDQQRHLFESFQQADASITRRYGGSGLGLAISKQLVGLMDGQIGVDSAPGAGATFWFTARLGVDRATPERAPRAELRGRRTLVVDDSAPAREAIAAMLARLGFEASTAADGRAALGLLDAARARAQPFEVVLVDWQLPGTDGIALAREIARRPQAPAMLMLSGLDRDAAQAAAAGVREVLLKPVTPSTLLDALGRQFGLAAIEPAPASGDALSPAEPLAGARALLVEDNALNQEVAAEFLRALGLEVDIAGNGQVALQRLREQRYDVVLLDMQMPVLDGLSTAREIRRRPELAGLPVLAMTANALAGDRERCLAAGMDDHIAKPIAPQDLRDKLLRWVRPQPRPPATAAAAAAAPAGGDWDGIAGLDSALGLQQAAERGALYRKLLGCFVADQDGAVQRLSRQIAAAEWTDAERAAHTLKGVAAQIGATALRQQAEALELALRARAPLAELQPLLQQLDAGLQPLLQRISARMAQQDPPTAASAFDAQRWQALHQRLLALLAQDDSEAVALFEAEPALLRSALGARFEPLAQAMRGFDFDAALALLKPPGGEP